MSLACLNISCPLQGLDWFVSRSVCLSFSLAHLCLSLSYLESLFLISCLSLMPICPGRSCLSLPLSYLVFLPLSLLVLSLTAFSLSGCLSVCLSVCLCISVCWVLSVFDSVVCLSVCLSVSLSICVLSVCVSLSVSCLTVWLSCLLSAGPEPEGEHQVCPDVYPRAKVRDQRHAATGLPGVAPSLTQQQPSQVRLHTHTHTHTHMHVHTSHTHKQTHTLFVLLINFQHGSISQLTNRFQPSWLYHSLWNRSSAGSVICSCFFVLTIILLLMLPMEIT